MRKHLTKRLLSCLLVFAMLLGVMPVAAAQTAASIYDLRVNDLVAPVGIDDLTPSFSWKMASDVIGAAQTAYQIVVTDGESETWNTGWVESSDSIAIAYGGEALRASTMYTVSVRIQDQDGAQTAPAETTFETGLMSETPFADAAWIGYQTPYLSDTTRYTIDFDFALGAVAQGFCFGIRDTANLVMWQINDMGLLRPHFCVNSKFNKPLGGTSSDGADLKAALGYGTDGIIGKTIHERIEVDGKVIKTYLGSDIDNLTLAHTYTHTEEVPLYNVGWREGTKEYTFFDNLVVKDGDGTVLYSNDFSGSVNISGTTVYALQDGRLSAGLAGNTSTKLGVFVSLETGNSLPAYRKEITVPENLVSAKLYTSGLGVYESYINGQRVGRLLEDGSVAYDELKPGFTEVRDRKFYNTYDVTWMLDAGAENALSAVVSSGWWSGTVAPGSVRGKETAYLAKLILTCADGTTQTVVTDTSWKTSKAAALQSGTGIFQGERYDARVDQSWMLPGFDDSTWGVPKINTEFKGVVTAWSGVPVTVRTDLERAAQKITVYEGADGAVSGQYGKIHVVRTYADGDAIELNPGETLLVDFGQNFAGWEALEFRTEAGTRLDVRHGEALNDGNGATSRGNDGPEGSVYDANYRSASGNTIYYASGAEYETYHPSHTYYGFRYIEIKADKPVTFFKITGCVVTSSQEDTGELVTSDAAVNQLVSNARWGMYSNYLSVPTDCPQRDERQGWSGDTQSFAEAGCYLGNSKSFLMKFMLDMNDSQRTDGCYPPTAPSGFGVSWGGAGWADAGVIVPYLLYVMYGDADVITENWDHMEKWMEYRANNGIERGDNGGHLGVGDHLSYGDNDTEIKQMLDISYYAWVAQLMSYMAKAIDLPEKAEEYRGVYEAQKAYYQSLYVLENGALKRDVQTPCLYALYLDLLPNEESVAMVTKQLTDNIERNGNTLQTGFLGTEIILHTLTKIGRTDLAYKLLLQHDCPSWLYSVDQGATTMWERWNSYTISSGFGDVSMNSFNHYSYGSVASWMFRGMAGITWDMAEPGFRHIILAPRPDRSLPEVRAVYESAYGEIVSDMAYAGTDWNYEATIPANTTATVYIPVEAADCVVTVNGKPVEALTMEADGLVYTGMEDGALVFDAVACTFTVESARDPRAVAKDVANSALESLAPYQNIGAVTVNNLDGVRQAIRQAREAVAAYEALGGQAEELTNGLYILGAEAVAAHREKFLTDHFTIDFDFTIERQNQGFCFGMEDSNNLVMWQINTYKNANSDKAVLLRPHFRTNGTWKTSNIDVTAAIGYNGADLIGKTVHERIEVEGNVVRTYFGPDADHLTLANTFTHTENILLSAVGIRHSTAADKDVEICAYDNIEVRDGNGVLIYAEDFSEPEQVVITGSNNTYYTMEDGTFAAGTTSIVTNQIYILHKAVDPMAEIAAVDALIEAIDVEDKATIEAARAAYDALSDEAKALVTKYAALEAAELHWNTVNNAVSLVLTGADSVNPVDGTAEYTLSAKGMHNLATLAIAVEIPEEYLSEPAATPADGWMIVAQVRKDGILHVVAANNDGANGDGEILTITAKVHEKAGTATVAVTSAEMGAYLGEEETFVQADLSAASVTTVVEYNVYDVNKDGEVNLLDIARAQRYYGSYHADADVNRDGVVDIDDLIRILNNYTDLFQ